MAPQYTQQLQEIINGYNLTAQEVIFSFALASGAPQPDAYRIIFNQNNKTTNTQCEALANSLLTSKPALKILINRIKNHKNPTTYNKQQAKEINIQEETEEEKNRRRDEFKTRDGLITKLIDSVYLTSGKDQVSGLQTLAKMQGLDKPEETTEEEKRRYFLPWVSNCRTCALMKLYKQVVLEEKP